MGGLLVVDSGLFMIKQDEREFNFCLLLADRLGPNSLSAVLVDELIPLTLFPFAGA